MSSANDEDDNLRRGEERDETRAVWGGAAVIFGLVLEVGYTIAYAKGQSILEEWGPVLADAFVALGVATEVLYAARARSKAATIKRRSDEKIAAANERAENAQLETARLKAQFSWRGLGTQADKLQELLLKSPGKVSIEYVEADPDSMSLAKQFVTAIRFSNWTVTSHAGAYGTSLRSGIIVPEPDSKSDSAPFTVSIREALTRAGIEFATDRLPEAYTLTGDMPNVNIRGSAARIFIGPKEPRYEPIAKTNAKTSRE